MTTHAKFESLTGVLVQIPFTLKTFYFLWQGYQPYGEIKVDKENKQAKGDLREGHYACRGVPWVEDSCEDMWPDQWPPEVRHRLCPSSIMCILQFHKSQYFVWSPQIKSAFFPLCNP